MIVPPLLPTTRPVCLPEVWPEPQDNNISCKCDVLLRSTRMVLRAGTGQSLNRLITKQGPRAKGCGRRQKRFLCQFLPTRNGSMHSIPQFVRLVKSRQGGGRAVEYADPPELTVSIHGGPPALVCCSPTLTAYYCKTSSCLLWLPGQQPRCWCCLERTDRKTIHGSALLRWHQTRTKSGSTMTTMQDT